MKIPCLFTLVALFMICFTAKAQQDNSKETLPETQKSMPGIQVGLLGVWGYYEFSAARLLAVRTEAGINWYYGGGFIGVPAITIEPRFYYNLDNRKAKGKSTQNNAGNFVALSHRYNYSGANFSTSSNIDFAKTHGISVIARWGLRRDLGKRFDFETSAGVGYGVRSDRNNPMHNYANTVFDLQVRLGYRF